MIKLQSLRRHYPDQVLGEQDVRLNRNYHLRLPLFTDGYNLSLFLCLVIVDSIAVILKQGTPYDVANIVICLNKQIHIQYIAAISLK